MTSAQQIKNSRPPPLRNPRYIRHGPDCVEQNHDTKPRERELAGLEGIAVEDEAVGDGEEGGEGEEGVEGCAVGAVGWVVEGWGEG